MAYDRYVAICNPLLYNVAMTPKVCFQPYAWFILHGICWCHGFSLNACWDPAFCEANTINHYMCDIMPLQLSYGTPVNELVDSIIAGFNVIVPSMPVSVSYVFILSNIFKSGPRGRIKAFGTCSSHVIAVSLFFWIIHLCISNHLLLCLWMRKISSVFYTNTVPLLNPLIYSLRSRC